MLDSLPTDASRSFARLLETKDDAAVVPVTADLVLVQTVDFFTPIVDDPYWYGQIAAANSLSDVYAMGARPLTAMNLVAWPASLGMDPLAEILRGGLEKIEEAGAELAGGHSIDDKEPKYGLAVTGVARPDEIVYNAGAEPGDLLVLTKRIGIGVLASALKYGHIAEEEMMPAMREAASLNAAASRVMVEVGVHAATDVTGFGLLGHLSEMLDAGGGGAMEREVRVGARINAAAVPLHERVLEFISAGVYAGGLRANRDFLAARVAGLPLDDPVTMALFDPQTSGGLLMAVAPARHGELLAALSAAGVSAWTVGEVTASVTGTIELANEAAHG
jgi:selenide,water dikinase